MLHERDTTQTYTKVRYRQLIELQITGEENYSPLKAGNTAVNEKNMYDLVKVYLQSGEVSDRKICRTSLCYFVICHMFSKILK